MNPVISGAPSGAKLTYLPFVIKALSISLGKFPGLNTCLEPGGGALLQHHSHNIGVAMATSNGLVVPNIKQVRAQHCAAVSVQYRCWETRSQPRQQAKDHFTRCLMRA